MGIKSMFGKLFGGEERARRKAMARMAKMGEWELERKRIERDRKKAREIVESGRRPAGRRDDGGGFPDVGEIGYGSARRGEEPDGGGFSAGGGRFGGAGASGSWESHGSQGVGGCSSGSLSRDSGYGHHDSGSCSSSSDGGGGGGGGGD